MGYYDITVVSLSDKAKTTIISHIQEVTGKVIKQVEIGTKTLVYPIKKQKEAYLCAFVVECDEEKIRTLGDAISADKETLRHLIIKSDSAGSTLSYGEKLKEDGRPDTKESEAVKPKIIDLKTDDKAEKEVKKEPAKKETAKPVKKVAKISKAEAEKNKKSLDEKLAEILEG